jgi:hypothetical protein
VESPLDDLYDEYPVGWVLTYRRRRTPGPPAGSCAAGVVVGSPVRDPHTGLDTILTVWVPDRDVIGIEPRRPPDGAAAW